jgi:hypothetical protein
MSLLTIHLKENDKSNLYITFFNEFQKYEGSASHVSLNPRSQVHLSLFLSAFPNHTFTAVQPPLAILTAAQPTFANYPPYSPFQLLRKK